MPKIVISTHLGEFVIALFDKQAPLTCAYFSGLIREGAFRDSNIFRIVAAESQLTNDPCPIQVVQLGLVGCMTSDGQAIIHEGTNKTGLSHKKWTVSAARLKANELFGSFFVCMRNEPSLDFGGKRHPDGSGFAAFGEIISGFETLERIYQCYEAAEWLENEIPIHSISLIDAD